MTFAVYTKQIPDEFVNAVRTAMIVTSVIGIVLGIVALNQIKKTGQRGKELAISGIVLGGLVLAAGIALGIFIGALASVSP